MSEPQTRVRRRCCVCNPSHMMDDLGPVLRDDVVTETMCPTAASRVAAQLRGLDKAQAISSKPPAPVLDESGVTCDEAGVDVDAVWPGHICAMCLLGAIILFLGIAIGAVL